jgi:hypothetical protein
VIVNFLLTSYLVFNQQRSADREAKFIAGAATESSQFPSWKLRCGGLSLTRNSS